MAAVEVRRRVVVTGVVQGVGFRPFVWRRATRLRLAGWVANESGGVVIEVRGPAANVATFLDRLVEDAPPLAAIRSVQIDDGSTSHDVAPAAYGFAILESARRPGRSTLPPADVATPAGAGAHKSGSAPSRFVSSRSLLCQSSAFM